MPIHTVRQGEYLSKVALDYHFADWRTIYDHPQNAEFRRLRPDPDLILPGDRIFIPEKTQKTDSAGTDQVHRYRVPANKALLRLVVKNHAGEPLANQPYTLKLGRELRSGTTDGDGLLEERLPPRSDEARLTLPELGVTWTLLIGHLDPLDDPPSRQALVSGAQARLNNLGFPSGPVDGILGRKTRAALRAFQRAALDDDEPSGELDSDTRRALTDQHGC